MLPESTNREICKAKVRGNRSALSEQGKHGNLMPGEKVGEINLPKLCHGMKPMPGLDFALEYLKEPVPCVPLEPGMVPAFLQEDEPEIADRRRQATNGFGRV